MQPIYPMTETCIRGYVGRPICAVMHDGTYVCGTVVDCCGGQLYLDNVTHSAAPLGLHSRPVKLPARKKKRPANKAGISFFAAGIAAFAIALIGIAALFALPYGYAYRRGFQAGSPYY